MVHHREHCGKTLVFFAHEVADRTITFAIVENACRAAVNAELVLYGSGDEIISFVVARGLSRTGPGGGDSSESIITHAVALDNVNDWLNEQLAKGRMLDPKVYTALHWLQSGIIE